MTAQRLRVQTKHQWHVACATASQHTSTIDQSDPLSRRRRTCDAPDAPDGQLCHHAGYSLVAVRLVQQHAVPVHTVQQPGGA